MLQQSFQGQPSPRDFRRIWVWINAYLLAIAIVHVLGGVQWFRNANMISGNTDFTALYVSSRLLLTHPPSQLYDLDLQDHIQREVLGDYRPPERLLPYVYPPYEAVLFLPLGVLPFNIALLVWLVISLALLVYLPFFLTTGPLSDLATYRTTVLLEAFSFFPFLACLWRGQVSILLLLLLSLFYSSLKDGKEFRAGVFLGLAFIKFHLVYLFVLPLILKKRTQALLGTSLTLGVCLVASGLWIGATGLRGYVSVLGNMATTLGSQGKMQCWQGQLYLLGFEAVHELSGRVVLAGVGIALTVLLWRGQWLPAGRDFELRFSAQILLALLASPHCHIYDLSLAFLPMVFVLRYLISNRSENSRTWFLLAGLLLVSPWVWLLTLWISGFVPLQLSVVWMTVVLIVTGALVSRDFSATRTFSSEQDGSFHL